MTAVITQPTYMPWLGYFQLVMKADVFVFLDCVQFVQRTWDSRNRLKGFNDQPFWLTVPVASHRRNIPTCDIQISPHHPDWREKHLKSLQASLGSAPRFSEVYPEFEAWLREPHHRLADLNISGIRRIAGRLGFAPAFLRASDLGTEGMRTRLLVDILQRVGASHYLANAGSREYLEADRDLFLKAGITYEYQRWNHPVYPQVGASFVSHLACPDALCYLGWDGARRKIIEGCGTP